MQASRLREQRRVAQWVASQQRFVQIAEVLVGEREQRSQACVVTAHTDPPARLANQGRAARGLLQASVMRDAGGLR